MKAVILAGGCGSRLWPLSRDMYPKQLLSIDDNLSLLQQTVLRLGKFVAPDRILTVTNIKHIAEINRQLNNLNANSVVLGEPIGKNTARCSHVDYGFVS